MAIRVYTYGLRPPTVNAERVVTQMRLAHTYRNVLVEIERERRTTIRSAMAAHPDMAPIEAELAELATRRQAARDEILAARRLTRSRSDTAQQRQLVRDLGAQVKALRQRVKDNRQAVAQDAQVRAKLDAAEERARQRLRDERARCGVYWGTYLLQESDADRARQEKTMPEFRPWRGEGRVSVQLQGGLEVEKMFGGDTQLHVVPVSTDAHDMGCRRGDRRRAARTTLRIRCGSDETRKPIWAMWPMIYHRAVPPGSQIKIATVVRRRRDCRTWDWSVHLTVDVPESASRPAPAAGAIALDLGFCLRPEGTIRSGYMVADDGYEQEIRVPASVIDAVGKSESIRSIRDKNMDAMRADLAAWLASAKHLHQNLVEDIDMTFGGDDVWGRLANYIALCGPVFPAWFWTRTETLGAWRSPARFRSLAFYWRQHRFWGDEVPFRLLEGQDGEDGAQPWRGRGRGGWRYRDEHLERYETGMRRRALLRRREGYRILAAQMAARYHTLVVSDMDLRDTQRSPSPESGDVEIPAVKYNQRIAAASELRNVMLNAFGPGRTIKVSHKDVTTTCNTCQTVNVWDRQYRLTHARGHTCTHCGARWDEDANAARNMLREHARAIRDGDGARNDKDAKPKLSRSERLRAARANKAATQDRSHDAAQPTVTTE